MDATSGRRFRCHAPISRASSHATNDNDIDDRERIDIGLTASVDNDEGYAILIARFEVILLRLGGGIDGGDWWAAAAGVKRLSCDPFLSLHYFKIFIHHLPKT